MSRPENPQPTSSQPSGPSPYNLGPQYRTGRQSGPHYPSAQYVAQQYPGPPVIAPKNGGIGLLISIFLPGVGSMVNGDSLRGVIILVLYVFGVALSIVLVGIPLAIGAWIWGLVDGYQSAQRWNRAHGIIS